VDTTALRRLLLRFEATTDSAHVHHVAHQHVSQPMMAQRFRVDPAGALARSGLPDTGAWHAELRVHGRDVGVQLRFTPDEREVVLPRPLGVALRAGDSITLVVHAPRLVLLLSIDYEPLDGRGARLSVDPLSADLTSGDNARAVSWEFSPEFGGRVLAVCGALLARAASVQLVSVTSGEVLWSLTLPVHAQHGSGEVRNVVRLGVPVRAGEIYRLTAILSDASGAVPTVLSATAMVLPERRGQ